MHNRLRREIVAALDSPFLELKAEALLKRCLDALGGPVVDGRPNDLDTRIHRVAVAMERDTDPGDEQPVHGMGAVEDDTPVENDPEEAINTPWRDMCHASVDEWCCTQVQGHIGPHRARGQANGEVYREWTGTPLAEG